MPSKPDVVINATAIGLQRANTPMPITTDVVEGAICYDMGYGANAAFHQWAQIYAQQSLDGLGMLVEQAAVAYQIWRNVLPQTDQVLADLRQQLRGNADA